MPLPCHLCELTYSYYRLCTLQCWFLIVAVFSSTSRMGKRPSVPVRKVLASHTVTSTLCKARYNQITTEVVLLPQQRLTILCLAINKWTTESRTSILATYEFLLFVHNLWFLWANKIISVRTQSFVCPDMTEPIPGIYHQVAEEKVIESVYRKLQVVE